MHLISVIVCMALLILAAMIAIVKALELDKGSGNEKNVTNSFFLLLFVVIVIVVLTFI